ncbi:MAG: phosphoglycerate mutase, partial [Desulfuromonadaceae bacterium]|nr:phosphoglycerate mutase [Desulfuromonadaceae bacterium]
GGAEEVALTPPHDITRQQITPFLPRGNGAKQLILLMNSSMVLFAGHPVNQARIAAGKVPANSIWLWGQGKAPRIATMKDRFGITGAVISAVDLIKGIGLYAGLDVIRVPGATGYLDTNFAGKADHALAALENRDFVFVHVEAPDEASHEGSLDKKLRAIEEFDRLVVGRVIEGAARFGDFRLMVLPDHPTPIRLMTHSADAVPYALFSSSGEFSSPVAAGGFGESAARSTGLYLDEGHLLLSKLIHGPEKYNERTVGCII